MLPRRAGPWLHPDQIHSRGLQQRRRLPHCGVLEVDHGDGRGWGLQRVRRSRCKRVRLVTSGGARQRGPIGKECREVERELRETARAEDTAIDLCSMSRSAEAIEFIAIRKLRNRVSNRSNVSKDPRQHSLGPQPGRWESHAFAGWMWLLRIWSE